MKRRLLAMDWRDALFAHWPVAPERIADSLPAGVTPRTHSGNAWLGIVAFVMEDIRPRGAPEAFGLTFGEVNLRTYVRGPDGEPGIYFYNLDAADPLGVYVARYLYRLPYYRAAMQIDREQLPSDDPEAPEGNAVDFTSHRVHPGTTDAHIDATYEPVGDLFVPDSGSLAKFLVENYRFYLARGDVGEETPEDAAVYYGDVDHAPWPLYEADLDLRSTNFFAVNGFERPDVEPLVHYSPGVYVEADRIRRVD